MCKYIRHYLYWWLVKVVYNIQCVRLNFFQVAYTVHIQYLVYIYKYIYIYIQFLHVSLNNKANSALINFFINAELALLFNETCKNENILPRYTDIYIIYIQVYYTIHIPHDLYLTIVVHVHINVCVCTFGYIIQCVCIFRPKIL